MAHSGPPPNIRHPSSTEEKDNASLLLGLASGGGGSGSTVDISSGDTNDAVPLSYRGNEGAVDTATAMSSSSPCPSVLQKIERATTSTTTTSDDDAGLVVVSQESGGGDIATTTMTVTSAAAVDLGDYECSTETASRGFVLPSTSNLPMPCIPSFEDIWKEKEEETLQTVIGSNASDTEVFIYTGEGGAAIPDNVVRVRIDPSVTLIPDQAFLGRLRNNFTDVELCEGLVQIGRSSFAGNDHSITKIIIPSTLRRICNQAFYRSLRSPIRLHDGIDRIGGGAFAACIFTNFRIPPLITMIPEGMLDKCSSMISLEMPENVTEIGFHAFTNCYFLRNMAIPPNAVINGVNRIFVDDDEGDVEDEMMAAFVNTDLSKLFGISNARIISELQHRFDGLPIHRLIYYQSYNQGVLQILIAAINMRSGEGQTLLSEMDPTGNQQDCLGMTPLHILTCSSVHDLEVYRLIVEKYPANLITEDRWGAVPLLYAFWGGAPSDIIQFLLENYSALYPRYQFNWTMMVETMGRTDTPKERIEILLCVKKTYFPGQIIDWVYLLDKFMRPSSFSFDGALFRERMQFLVMCGISERVECLAFKVWRECIFNMIHTAAFTLPITPGNT